MYRGVVDYFAININNTFNRSNILIANQTNPNQTNPFFSFWFFDSLILFGSK
jgi:hypothetical protein